MPIKVYEADMHRLPRQDLDAWARIPVTIASDVTAGQVIADPHIRPLRPFPLGRRMVGQAVTAWCERGDFGPVLHALDIARAGDVIVVDAGGCVQTAYAGEILCNYARSKGIAGLVVNGALRDIDTIASWEDFPAFASGNTARGPLSKDRGFVNGEMVFAGVAARPGDIVLGDNDGLAIIPRGQACAVLSEAQKRVAMEEGWMAKLASGRTLGDVFGLNVIK